MDWVAGATVIAGLKYIGPPTTELVKDFLGRILSPSADAIGSGVAAPIQAWAKRRVEVAEQTITKAAILLHDAKIEPQTVPGRILMPILEKASLEEDDNLHRRWVALLANAAGRPGSVSAAFPNILSELSPLDA